MREPSHADATLALTLYDLRREHELRKARRMIGDLCMGTYEDVQAVMDYGHKHNAHFRQATSYWEMCASFVNRGVFHPAIFLDTCGEGLFTYAGFQPLTDCATRASSVRWAKSASCTTFSSTLMYSAKRERP